MLAVGGPPAVQVLLRQPNEGRGSMKITYDETVDAAYIYLAEQIEPGQVSTTYPCDPAEVRGMIHLDFDAGGVLLGIEVLGASSKLPPEVIEQARALG